MSVPAPPPTKLLTMRQIQDLLGSMLPVRPSYRQVIRAISLGMPTVVSPMLDSGSRNRTRYLFRREDVLAWWFPEAKADCSPTDTALAVAARRKAKAG